MKYKISVIVPIYNADKYLSDCINSIINQTLNFENIQLILVNDGSTDNSLKIAREFSEKYENIELINLEKSHLMAGFARNQGLKRVKGEYIMFSDADDCFDKKACELMYNSITQNNADIVTANYKCMEQNGVLWNNPMFDFTIYKSCELNKVDEKFFYLYCPSVCLKIFSAKLILENNIDFLEGVPAEDAYFSSYALLKSKKVLYNNETIYYYRRRNTGEVSTSWMRNEKYFRNINYAFKKIYELFEKENKLEYYKYYYARNLISLTYKFIDSKLITPQEKIQLIDEMYWFFEQSKLLKITFAPKTIEVLLSYIINKKYDVLLDICDVISEIRMSMNEVQKEKMSKPQKMII